MKKLFVILSMVLAISKAGAQNYKTLDEIQIRDPFIYADQSTNTYFLYQTSDTVIGGQTRGGVIVWRSNDLQKWVGPKRVFTCPADNYLTGQVWAPEMHKYKGKFYLFLTINSDIEWRGQKAGWQKYLHRVVQVMRAKSPLGPFNPITKLPTTAIDQMALDGTLYVEDDKPYIVYCNEWVQRSDGTFRLTELKPDLSHTIDDGHDLFCASAAPWCVPVQHSDDGTPGYVSDGCFIWRTSQKLLMLFSSFCKRGYTVGVAESLTGKIAGPWHIQPEPLIDFDGGHGMIFRDLGGQTWLVAHSPNSPSGKERARLVKIEETENGDIRVVE